VAAQDVVRARAAGSGVRGPVFAPPACQSGHGGTAAKLGNPATFVVFVRHKPCKNARGRSSFGLPGGGVAGPLALAVWLLAAPAGESEPGLLQTQEAAAKLAGGQSAADDGRVARARAARWAPQLRAQASGREDEKTRAGEFRLAPLLEHDFAAGHAWFVALTWDFSQLVFAREETQLALAH